jgi:bifunctional non-homologous end joining protein LigD
MTLEKYYRKRDFGITPEPRGKMVETGQRLVYFIQRHDARKLHYDFRLELEGTLKSWAIPKGPSLDPSDKRLAVHVEDHPVAYGAFEGEIPAHQYGAGSVLLWDKGWWIPDGDPADGYRKGRLKFRLEGEKLSGGWTLVRMGTSGGKKENWLLIKEHDGASKTGGAANITELQPDSVKARSSKKSGAVKSSVVAAQPKRRSVPARKESAATGNIEGAVEADMPEMITPQLATLTDQAPAGDGWLSEMKFDGYRALCRIENGAATLFSRTGNDWSAKWKPVAAAAAQLPVTRAWLDGEVVAIAADGSISFQALQNIARNQASGRLVYYVFDLVYLNGHDLHDVPLLQRKQLLAALLAEVDANGPILLSEHLAGDAQQVFSHACMHGMEGIIAKRADARYESSRSRNWLKIKCLQQQEFVIGGYTDPAGQRESFGALLVGVYDDEGRFRYAGKVGTGFDANMLKMLLKDFSKLETETPPFSNPPTGKAVASVHWLKPKMVAEIQFAQWTQSGLIRHASFIALRSDKPALEIRREIPLPITEIVAPQKKPKQAKAGTGASAHGAESKLEADPAASLKSAIIAGIQLSHPSRILFPETGLTKFKLAQYYEEIADWILPHLSQRPLTLVRCPHGGGQQCFFQKHANATTAKDIERIEVPSGGATATYMMANSVPGLISLVQMGVLELHTWGAGHGHLDKPDRIIFDLDPGPDLAWMQVIEAAQLIKGLLEQIGLTSFVKTTGGKGLHVVTPIQPEKSWDDIKAFSRAIAEHLESTLPGRFTSKMSKTRRTGKIFIDYLRNASEATAVAAYSTRARPGGPVSTPIAWDELTEDLRSDSFTVLNVRTRLQHVTQDPWAQYFQLKQRVTEKMLRTFGVK